MASNTAPVLIYLVIWSSKATQALHFPVPETNLSSVVIWDTFGKGSHNREGVRARRYRWRRPPESHVLLNIFPLKCKENEKDFSTPSQAAATAGPWVTNQSHCLRLLWPGEELCDTELAETGVKWWEFHEQNPGRPGVDAKDDDVKGTAKSKLVIWRQQHLHF